MTLAGDAELDRVFGELSFERFAREHFLKNQLLFLPPSSGRFESLYALPELQDAEALLRNWKGEVEVMPCTGGNASGYIRTNAAKAAELFGDDVTLQFNEAQKHIPLIGELARALELRLGAGVGICKCFLFVSRRTSMGFPQHFDGVDGLTLQLYGTKHWKIGRPDVAHPTNDHVIGRYPMMEELHTYWSRGLDLPADYEAADTQVVKVEQGSVLFMPSGWWHKTETPTQENSVSLLFALTTNRWVDVLLKRLRARLVRHDAWRMPALGALGGTEPSVRGHALETAASLLARLADDMGRFGADDLVESAPTPKTFDEMLAYMKQRFTSANGAQADAVVAQFLVVGDGPREFYAQIEGGKLDIVSGRHERPSIRFKLSLSDFLSLTSQALTMKNFMTGQIKIDPVNPQLAGRVGQLLFWA